MSTATETAPAAVQEGRPAWITLSEASRITGRHHSSIPRLVLAGTIAAKVTPGARTLYRRADCARLASAD